jgi:hypothetical protein
MEIAALPLVARNDGAKRSGVTIGFDLEIV